MKNNTSDYFEGVDGLLEHVEILRDNILSIQAPENFNISTEENAEETIFQIKQLQEQIVKYQRTARALRESLEREIFLDNMNQLQ